MPWKLLPGRSALYQWPFCRSMSGHMMPHEMTPPMRSDIITMYGQIIPTPMYVAEKSK